MKTSVVSKPTKTVGRYEDVWREAELLGPDQAVSLECASLNDIKHLRTLASQRNSTIKYANKRWRVSAKGLTATVWLEPREQMGAVGA